MVNVLSGYIKLTSTAFKNSLSGVLPLTNNNTFENSLSGVLPLTNNNTFENSLSGNIHLKVYKETHTLMGYIDLIRASEGGYVYSVDHIDVDDILMEDVYRIMGIR
jgi:hypothetical protein